MEGLRGWQEICERNLKESRGEGRGPEARHNLEVKGQSNTRDAKVKSQGSAVAPNARE